MTFTPSGSSVTYSENAAANARAAQEGWETNDRSIWLTVDGRQDDTPNVLRVDASDLIAEGLRLCGDGGSEQKTSSSSSELSSSSSTATTTARATCDSRTEAQNDAAPEFYRKQFADGLADNLKQKLSVYDSAVESDDPQQIATAAGDLYSEIEGDVGMTRLPQLFGCYSPAVLNGLQNATDAFAPTLDAMSCAGANACGRTRDELPGLLRQAEPLEKMYVEALNAYAAQFGGEQMAQP